jgi:N-methylhydantoinase B
VVNSSLAVAGAGVFVALKSTLDPGGAVNDGAFRPIKLKAPEASIVDVRADAPAGAHGEVRKRAVSVMLGCLAQVIPDKVSGDLCGTSFPNSIGGRANGRPYVYYEVPAGGNGGFAGSDGSSAFVNVDFGNIRSIYTAETLESDMPLVVEKSELRADSGGPGEHRGGLGLVREVRLVEAEGTYSVLSDRAVIPPFGVRGGGAAAPVCVSVNGKDLDTPGKATGMLLKEGDLLVMESAGGGGFGDPLARDPALVERDVAAGYVSAGQARERYGVVVGDAGGTKRLREKMATGGLSLEVLADGSDPYEGIRGRHRVLRLHPSCGLRENQLVELLGRHPAPLRAWVRLDPSLRAGATPLDPFGLKVLGVAPGARVRLRALDSPVAPGARLAK